MVLHKCDICNYQTTFPTNLKNHLLTKKHKRNVDKYEEDEKKEYATKIKNATITKKITENLNNSKQYVCNYCQKEFGHHQSLYRHKKICKSKKIIEKSGLYIMWNFKMIDENNNSYYKLGRTSNRKSRINSYAAQYKIKKEEIKFLYEVEIEDEKFAEKFLFNILEEFRISKYEELFNAPFDIIKNTMDFLKILLVNYKIKKNKDIIQDNIDLIMEESDEDLNEVNNDDEITKNYYQIKENRKYIKNIINGDYDMINEIKKAKKKLIPQVKCEYCNKFIYNDYILEHHKICLSKQIYDNEKEKLDEQIRKEEEQKKEEKDIVVNKLLEEITKMREEQKKKEEEQIEEIIKMREESEEMKKEIEKLKSENSTINNTTNNNTMNNSNNTTNHINNGTVINQLNNLNINFSNVIPMETFLYNMEHKYLIPERDIEAILYANDNLKIDDVADRIVKTLIANCKRQVKEMNMTIDDKKVLPIMPVVCTDSNLRSHKERLKDGWDTLYDDKYLDRMLGIINNRMCDLKRRVIFISKKNKNKVFSKIKKNTSMGELMKIQKEING